MATGGIPILRQTHVLHGMSTWRENMKGIHWPMLAYHAWSIMGHGYVYSCYFDSLADLQIFASADPHIFLSLHMQIFTPSHLHVLPSSHLHVLISPHLRLYFNPTSVWPFPFSLKLSISRSEAGPGLATRMEHVSWQEFSLSCQVGVAVNNLTMGPSNPSSGA